MAFLIPQNIPSRGDLSGSLRSVAGALRDWLGDDSTVWLENEEDEESVHLLVLAPRFGVVLISAPAGAARSTTRLRDKLRRQREAIALEPLDGAVMGRLHEITDRIETEPRFLSELRVVATLALPAADRESLLEDGLAAEEVDSMLLADDLSEAKLEEAIARILDVEPGKPIDEASERLVRGLLHPEIVIDGTVVEDAESGQLVFAPPGTGEEDVIRVLDREQERLARDLGGGYRVIRGVAGSGKTLVLVFRARFIAERFPQWRVLLTCFNACLARALEQQLEGLPNVEVRNIDKQLITVYKQAGKRFFAKGPEDWIAARQEAAGLLHKMPDAKKYDAVLVDEAQDFDGPALDLAFASLKNQKDHFVIALDAAQNIYRKGLGWNPPDTSARGRTTLLRRNYRNTREILDFAFRFLTEGKTSLAADVVLDDPGVIVPPESSARVGPRPSVLQCADATAEVETIVQLLKRRHDEGIAWGSMLVLYGTASPWQTKLYYRCGELDIPYFWVTNFKYKRAKEEVISCATWSAAQRSMP